MNNVLLLRGKGETKLKHLGKTPILMYALQFITKYLLSSKCCSEFQVFSILPN